MREKFSTYENYFVLLIVMSRKTYSPIPKMIIQNRYDTNPNVYLNDPRFNTDYAADYQGPWFQHATTFYIPSILVDEDEAMGCGNGRIPGYQKPRSNKGYYLTIDDYPFHNIYHHGGIWSTVVNTPPLKR